MTTMKFMPLLAAATLLAACSPTATWTDYVYKPQHFAAAFTAPPKVDPDPNPFLVEENDGSVDFGVTAVCNITSGKSPDEMMSDAIEGTRQNGTVRAITYTASGGVMGREMLVDRAGETTVKQRVFVKDKCMYLVFASSKDGPDDAAVTHFLDSFRML
jgi:hypothetical protein